MPSSDDDYAPEVGLTGARFGGAPRRRRMRSSKRGEPQATGSGPADTTDAPAPAGAGLPTPDLPAGSSVGITGARFAGAHHGDADTAPEDAPAAVDPPGSASDEPGYGPGYESAVPHTDAMPIVENSHRFVRPYVLTRGRTRPQIDLAIETLVSAAAVPAPPNEPMEHARIRAMCRQPRSVAEIAALMEAPLGVARVLLADLATAGGVVVHRTSDAAGPDLALMQRVLAGLKRL